MTDNCTERAASASTERGEVVGNDSASMRLLFDSSDTGGSLNSLEVRLRAGADGAAPHFHKRSSELFYVIDGELQVMAGDRIMTVEAGRSVVVPELMPHAFIDAPWWWQERNGTRHQG
ncbi:MULTISPECIES: cupin domain-containing protein [Rhodococcus]|jgi:mannose-6-phosphate isomerase-like protein (cupin superfamily)|uniref:cupin domain-containing protein n=1 Tax=Rhodococcus TaxID=1827 RepID=UPI00042E9F48|nr:MULTISPECIES: cupin domain-containing protein [Rhodococcus]AHK31976.1 hypothetical protein Pd630_LPD04763 [Rhodococcus opacus PD630]PBC53450.1 hypothetical protein CJ177_30570 [Rhodococcus sp. ACPA1]RZK72012.1 MAG: cupin domain-containing protein [Rhodococcus sp. (in: high G+C Gram-positive bacteria)]UDG94421.1 cupin domain-containing protein [Rhodococcus opacus PD630]